MSDQKDNASDCLDHSRRTTEIDGAASQYSDTISASSHSGPPPAAIASISNSHKCSSFLERAFSKQNKDAAGHFFSAYAQAWVGLSPVWLMGEALAPGTKVGTQFKKGKANLMVAAEEIRVAVSSSSRDIVIIVDGKLKAGQIDTEKTAEVLKAAGENAILVVSSSLGKAQAHLRRLNVEYGPKIRQSVSRNGRDVIVILDKALKHPVVITGVSKFAKSQGIPHADALLRLASLALARILNALPEQPLEGTAVVVEEIDAAELERTSSREDQETATEVGRQGDGDGPQVETVLQERTAAMPVEQDPYEKMKKGSSCVIT